MVTPLWETKGWMNKQFVFTILARMATGAARLRPYRILPLPWHAALLKTWLFAIRSRLLSDISFGFEAKVGGISFQLRGPFRYVADHYYVAYLIEGAYEAAVTRHITQVVRECPAPRVLDVGAHYGWYTIYLAKLIAGSGIVFAVEPSEAVLPFLKRNLELNKLHNVRLYKVPLSDKRETISMVTSKAIPRESRYMHTVTERAEMDKYADTLSAVPFDELNKLAAIHPNIVKIDVHGSWRKVVDGMTETLRKEVEHLYLEIDSPLTRKLSSRYTDIQHVILLLQDVGMDVYEIKNFRKRDGGKMIKADAHQIVQSGNKWAMLYAVKRT